jgi:hypothetical protein
VGESKHVDVLMDVSNESQPTRKMHQPLLSQLNPSCYQQHLLDAMEGRDVATVDIPGAFMQADIDKLVHAKFEDEIAEMLVKMDPKLYQKYVKDENGKTVLYVELLKALYGTMRAALLFWKLLSSKLVQWGFVINPYDWCVANKMIDGKQCTIVWHVDDLKISHINEKVNTLVIKLIDSEFGNEAPLTVTRGKIHEYLGMTLDYTEKGKVETKMLDYLLRIFEDLPEEFAGEAASPAANHLFTVDHNQTKLDEKRAQFFHTYVAKTLSYANVQGQTYKRPSHFCAPECNRVTRTTGKSSYTRYSLYVLPRTAT